MQTHKHTHDQDRQNAVAQTDGFIIHSWAKYYDLVGKVLFLGKEQRQQKKILDFINIKPDEIVLDVGCGTGKLAIEASRSQSAAGKITGIDPSGNMIALAKQKAQEAGVEVDFRLGVMENMEFPDNTFDLIVSTLQVHHLPDDLKITGIKEVYRVLKPGGRFVIVDIEPKIFSLPALLHGHAGAHDRPTIISQYTGYMESASFQDIQSGDTEVRSLVYLIGKKS